MNQYIAKCAGLRQERRGKGLYFNGHGRKWRVNMHGEFQMGDNNFDRWANSVERSEPSPKNKRELIAAVNRMLGTKAKTHDSA